MKPREGGLGPNQLAWIRKNIPSFEDAERRVIAAGRAPKTSQKQEQEHDKR